MLSRLAAGAARASAGLLAAVVLVAAAQLPALAGSGAGNGADPFGSVSCGQSYTPQCSVTAGTSQVPGTEAAGATPSGTGQGQGQGQAAAASGCSGTQDPVYGCVPAGCQDSLQTLACPIGTAGTQVAGAGDPAAAALAALARQYLTLPSPVIESSPALGKPQFTRLPTWLWISSAAWEPQTKTAAVPGETVTATATPAEVTWQMGNGAEVACDGPGTPYTGSDSPSSPSPDCGYTYGQPSSAEPGGVFQVTATITWHVAWAGGELAPLYTVAAAGFAVTQVQADNVAAGS